MPCLPSRNYPDPESFVEDFMGTLTPGIIPRSEFIGWERIEKRLRQSLPQLTFYAELGRRDGEVWEELAGSLLACDEPLLYIQCAFALLGHTYWRLVTQQDDLEISKVAEAIGSGNEEAARSLSETLRELGLGKVLARSTVEDVFLGIQIGLETHRRKNRGGKAFGEAVQRLLQQATQRVGAETGRRVQFHKDVAIPYGDGLSKEVDFAIEVDGKPVFGVEANFYTAPGSKPTEIKRSYGEIRRGLLEAGVDLIWITDGRGYREMKRSLRDAYVIVRNIYNLRMAEQFLAEDLLAALGGAKT
ncbi:MAG: DpnII family type II restriction endonuclease [Anaerolineae bacterium]